MRQGSISSATQDCAGRPATCLDLALGVKNFADNEGFPHQVHRLRGGNMLQ